MHQNVFEEVKEKSLKSLVLHLRDNGGHYQLHSHTSYTAMSGTLIQYDHKTQSLLNVPVSACLLQLKIRTTEVVLLGLATNIASVKHRLAKVILIVQ